MLSEDWNPAKEVQKRGISHSFTFDEVKGGTVPKSKDTAIKANTVTPLTSIRKLRRRKQQKISKWKPLYNNIVVLAIAGCNHSQIAEKLGCSSQLVSKVVNHPKAQKRIDIAFSENVDEVNKMLTGQLLRTRVKSVAAINRFLDRSDELEITDPFAFVKIAASLKESTDAVIDRGNGSVNIQNAIFAGENVTQILTALTRASTPSGQEVSRTFDKTEKLKLLKVSNG